MRVVYSLLLCLVVVSAFGQSDKTASQRSSINLERSNNNTIKVIQAGTVITYNLLNQQDAQKLLDYVMGIPSVSRQLATLMSEVKTQGGELKNLKKILLELVRNSEKDGYINIETYNQQLKEFILENEKLKAEISKLKTQSQNTEFAIVLAQAEEKLKQLDNEGYQQIIETFKQQRKAKWQQENHRRQQEQQEYAQAAYLQADNNRNQFQSDKALEQVDEALQFSTDVRYLLLKGNILKDIYRRYHLDSSSKYDMNIVYKQQEGSEKIIKHYTKALAICLKELGSENTHVGTIYINLGLAYKNKGECDKAVENYTKGLEIKTKLYGPKSFHYQRVAMEKCRQLLNGKNKK